MSPNKTPWQKSLKSRLALWVLFPSILVIAIDLFVTFRSCEQIATLVQQQLLHGAATMISQQLALEEDEYEISVPPAAFDLLKSKFKDRVFFSLRNRNGLLVSGDDELPPFAGKLQIDEEVFFLTTVRGEKVRVIAYAHVIPNAPSEEYMITQVAQTLRSHDDFMNGLLHASIRRHLILMAITAVFLAVAFRWMLKPIVEFSNSLTMRQPGSLVKLEENDAPTELVPVIHAMNDYVNRLGSTLSSYEKFVANTAHHLRNSFAIISTQINFGKRASGLDKVQFEVLSAIQKTLGNCTRVINQLLVLASLDQPEKNTSPAGNVFLASVVASVIEELAPLAQQKQIELGIDSLDERVIVPAPVRLLHELLANLIGNAIQHMKKAGEVTVSLSEENGRAHLAIIDNGIGIPEDQREKVFERFYRVDDASPDGSGLGLSIVKEICDSLNADVSLNTPANGTGLQVDILFPLADRALPDQAR